MTQPAQQHVYRIVKWSERHENHESRKIAGALQWIRVPTSQESMGLQRILAEPGGEGVFGVYVLLAELAGTLPVRGTLADEHGPLTLRDLEIRIRIKASRIKRALDVLCDPRIGWFAAEPYATPERSRSSPGEPGFETPPQPGRPGTPTPRQPGEAGAERDSQTRSDPAATPARRRTAGQEKRREEEKEQQQAEFSGNPGAQRAGGASPPLPESAAAANSPNENAEALAGAGVGEPALTRLAALPWLTPKLVHHFVSQVRTRNADNPAGLLVTLIETDGPTLAKQLQELHERAAKAKAEADAAKAKRDADEADLQRRLVTLPTDFAELDRLKAKYLERFPNAPTAMRNAFPHRSHALRIALLPIWEEEQRAKAAPGNVSEAVAAAGGAR